jgi:hypothetical protein
MTIVRHLVLTDIRRLRWTIAAWLIAILSATTLDAVVPLLPRLVQIGGTIGLTSFLLIVTLVLFGVLLIALIVHGDPAVGTSAFWMTRPIDPRWLWIAKVTLAGILLVAVPVLAQAVLLALSGVGPLEIARIAAESVLVRTVWMMVFMALASLTQGIGRFLLLCGAVLFGLAMALNIAATVSDGAEPSMFPPVPLQRHLGDPTPLLVAIVGISLAGLALVALQYQTRRRNWSVAAGLLALSLTLVVASFWRWPVFEPRLTVPAWALDPGRVRVSADIASLNFDEPFLWRAKREQWRTVHAAVSLGAMARGWHGDANLVDASVSFDRGVVVTSPGREGGSVSLEGSRDAAAFAVLRDLLEVHWLGLPDRPDVLPGQYPALLTLREDDVQRLGSARASYSGRYRIDLIEETVAGVLPLTPGATLQDGAHRLVIEDVERSGGGASVSFRERNAGSVFDVAVPWSERFYVRNTARTEAIMGLPQAGPDLPRIMETACFLSSWRSGLRNDRNIYVFPASRGVDQAKWSREAEWFAGAELVVIRSRPAGSVLRTLDISDFQPRR